MNKLLMHCWTISKSSNGYFLPYCHWIYLTDISLRYNEVLLLCPTNPDEKAEQAGLYPVSKFPNVRVIELPPAQTYLQSVPHLRSYYKAYQKLIDINTAYIRYPVPFGWLSRIFFKKKNAIIHFVGDPIEITLNSWNYNFAEKFIKIFFFLPEHVVYLWACKKATVYTEGYRMLEKLKKAGIRAKPVFSSTLIEEDYYLDSNRHIIPENLRILHVGYLLKWKGVEIVVRSFKKFNDKYPGSRLTIVGSGSYENELKKLVSELQLFEKVTFTGHIEDRNLLNRHYRTHDVFCQTSVSEGSPRVVIEAMANGLNVVCTPTGSLPRVFEHNKELLFVDFNNVSDVVTKLEFLASDNENARIIRENAHKHARNLSMKDFLDSVLK